MTHVYLPHIARNMHSPGRWEHYQQLVKALWRSTKKSRLEQSREMADQERMVRAAHRLLWEFDVPVRSEAPTESGSHIGAGWKDTGMQPKKEAGIQASFFETQVNKTKSLARKPTVLCLHMFALRL